MTRNHFEIIMKHAHFRGECVFGAASVAQSCTLSVSPEIVAAHEDFFDHGWTRINTDEDGISLIRVHPCSSVVGLYWLRLRRAVPYRGFVIRRLRQAQLSPASPTVCRLRGGDTADSWEELCFAVPKGQPRIAQRFNAGLSLKRSRVPKGRPRPNPAPHPSVVPDTGLVCDARCFPALKRRAILMLSLRDKGTWQPPFPASKQPD